jgi:hypothetical protein
MQAQDMRNAPGTAILALLNGFIAFVLLGLLVWWGESGWPLPWD